MAQAPTKDQAYKMIRFLKNRGAKGDGEKIQELRKIIKEADLKEAALLADTFFK